MTISWFSLYSYSPLSAPSLALKPRASIGATVRTLSPNVCLLCWRFDSLLGFPIIMVLQLIPRFVPSGPALHAHVSKSWLAVPQHGLKAIIFPLYFAPPTEMFQTWAPHIGWDPGSALLCVAFEARYFFLILRECHQYSLLFNKHLLSAAPSSCFLLEMNICPLK